MTRYNVTDNQAKKDVALIYANDEYEVASIVCNMINCGILQNDHSYSISVA